ncbi:MAG: class I SAM-dependent methyltransferase [Burkholderiales bacterium]|nr:class I SAM-dependent methyltransferase [Burkholderiales bacterium]
MSRLLFLLAACAAAVAFAQHGTQPMHRHFGDAERWAQVFDDPARDRWQKPEQVIGALDLAPDARVADIGSGTGYFAVRLARAVPKGKVYGADLEPDMVQYLNARAKKEGLDNVSAHVAAPDDPKLPEPVDLVLLVNTYHHIGTRTEYFARLRESLRPGGRVAIVDFKLDSPTGPPPAGRIAPGAVEKEMTRAGYRKAAAHDFLPYQYFLVFAPAS